MTEKKKMGRPKKEINWELFEQLCHLQCTQSEIASVLKLDVETLRDNARLHYNEKDFSAICKRYAEGGKVSIRRYQFNIAKKNATMSIWLGKQYLNQKDDSVQEISQESKEALNSLIYQLRSLQSNKDANNINIDK